MRELKREKRVLTADDEYLKFDSTIEGGNLDRAEVYPLSMARAARQRLAAETVHQMYNLYCKVDTNTKGHQQWFYFKVTNTRLLTRYTFSIRNFTKPFSLFKQGMQVQMLSKKAQAEYVELLKAKIE